MTNPGRLKDLSDVLELIKVLDLPLNFGDQLHVFVRDKFKELWSQGRKRYVTAWQNQGLTTDAKSIEEMIAMLRSAANQLDQMRQDGLVLEIDSEGGDDARLVTTDPQVAEKYGLVDEADYWEADEEEQGKESGK